MTLYLTSPASLNITSTAMGSYEHKDPGQTWWFVGTFQFAALDQHVAAVQTGLLVQCGSHECSTRSFRLPTVHRSEGGLRPAPSAPFLPNHNSAFCLWKENSYFYIWPVSFLLWATQSEGSNHSVPTKQNRQIAGQETKRTDRLCVTAHVDVSTAISDWSENQTHGQSLFSTPHKEHFSSFFNQKREMCLLDVRFN